MKHSTYHRRRAQIRFDETMKFMEDGDQKSRIPQNYNKWRKSKKVKNYWAQREQQEREEYKEGQDNQSSSASINSSIPTSSSSVTRKESIETISLDEAKDLILPRILPCDTASIKDSLDNITASSSAHFQAHILNSLTSTSLLTLETHLQHLLAMSNIDCRKEQKLPRLG